jgi:hypothetical protein
LSFTRFNGVCRENKQRRCLGRGQRVVKQLTPRLEEPEQRPEAEQRLLRLRRHRLTSRRMDLPALRAMSVVQDGHVGELAAEGSQIALRKPVPQRDEQVDVRDDLPCARGKDAQAPRRGLADGRR